MGIKLYGRPPSPFARTAMMALYEKDVEDFELVELDQKTPEYLLLNPFAKHPAYQEGDIVIYESRAIARYVAARFEGQGTPLLGSNLREEAMINQWIDVESQTFFPPILAVTWELFFKPAFFGKPTDDALVEENSEKLGKVLDVYEAHLAKSKYLAGDVYTLADLVHTPMIQVLMEGTGKGDLVTSREHVSAWWESISTRPAWKRICQLSSYSLVHGGEGAH